jgi:KaiC/GvpD/RAD55 family RecA-like ATPase
LPVHPLDATVESLILSPPIGAYTVEDLFTVSKSAKRQFKEHSLAEVSDSVAAAAKERRAVVAKLKLVADELAKDEAFLIAQSSSVLQRWATQPALEARGLFSRIVRFVRAPAPRAPPE